MEASPRGSQIDVDTGAVSQQDEDALAAGIDPDAATGEAHVAIGSLTEGRPSAAPSGRSAPAQGEPSRSRKRRVDGGCRPQRARGQPLAGQGEERP
jgi:hypothetical protein